MSLKRKILKVEAKLKRRKEKKLEYDTRQSFDPLEARRGFKFDLQKVK